MPWRILVVDDDPTIAAQNVELLESAILDESDLPAHVVACTSFDEALTLLDQGQFDLLVLDIRHQELAKGPAGAEATDSGLIVFRAVRDRRFLPIVFFTALPDLAADLARPPFVSVVSKTGEDSSADLRAAVRAAFDSVLPRLNRALNDHVEGVTRDFMIRFLEPNWPELGSPPRRGDLAHLLLRRLSMSLASGAHILAGALGDTDDVDLTPETVHPMRLYVAPPVGGYVTGDLFLGHRAGAWSPQLADPGGPSLGTEVAVAGEPAAPISQGGDGATTMASDHVVESTAVSTGHAWYVLLTPACDLVPTRVKAEFVVLAECIALEDFEIVKRWRTAGDGLATADLKSAAIAAAEKKVLGLMKNRADDGRQNDRFLYLPAAWNVPDLVVDLQRIIHVPLAALVGYDRVATLDSPYAEGLINQFGRYLGRVGTPDLNHSVALARLQGSTHNSAQSRSTPTASTTDIHDS